MEKFQNVIGIDFSEDKFDVFNYLSKQGKVFENTNSGHKAFVKWFKESKQKYKGNHLVCFEHTGVCTLNFMGCLEENKIEYAVKSGYEIKYSLGFKRDKTDPIDARDIAEYGYLRRNTLPLFKLPSRELLKLKPLITLRESLVESRAGFKSTLRSYKKSLPVKDFKAIHQNLELTIKDLTKSIKKVESEIKKIINQAPELKEIFELVTSIKSVGLIVGVAFLVYTNGFKSFDNARKFACYSGTAPFSNSSGKQIKKKRVSQMANKRMQKLLTMAAYNAIVYNPEMKIYYQRRLAEGKNKMSTINIIRNKIITRVFAVVKRRTPYVETMKFAA